MLSSCTEKIGDNLDTKLESKLENDVVVLKERNANFPWNPSDFKSNLTLSTKSDQLRATPISYRAYLGFTLKDNVYPFEDMRNLGYPIVNINKLAKDYPLYVLAWRGGTGEAKSFSYSSFDRYVTNSSITSKVNTGFSLNLGIFSIGSKKTVTNIFTSSLANSSNAVFGELNIFVRDSCYKLQISSNTKQLIKSNYIMNEFKNELYNTHPSELFYNYGGFVLSNYVTGGRATALYAGIYKKTETEQRKESGMGREISASFKKDSGSGAGNLNFGRDNKSGISITNEFSELKMSVKTIGGNATFAAFSSVKDINNTNINLSEWMRSLNDKSTHAIVEVNNDGLIPVSEFIPEENIKKIFNRYYATGVSKFEPLKEPYIRIGVATNPTLSKSTIPNTNTVFDVDFFDPASLKKTEIDGTIYLISDKMGKASPFYNEYRRKKIAFSVYGPRVISSYGLSNFINSLPTAKIDYTVLINEYAIFAF